MESVSEAIFNKLLKAASRPRKPSASLNASNRVVRTVRGPRCCARVPGALLVPLNELARRAEELQSYRERHLVAVCRSGVRSTTAAAILTSLGFERVCNMKGGMLAWNDAGLAVER